LDQAAIRWTFEAEIETRQAPAFRHRLRVPRELLIESVSVRRDDVERLVRWSRDGELVELFLSDRAVGLEDLLLRARQSIEPGSIFDLPVIRVVDAEVVESVLELQNAAAFAFVLAESGRLERIEDGSDASAADEGAEAGRRFHIRPEGDVPRIRIEPVTRPVPATEPAGPGASANQGPASAGELAGHDSEATSAPGPTHADRQAAVTLFETRIDPPAGGRRAGRSTFTLSRTEATGLPLRWPADTRLLGVQIDGGPIEPPEPAGGVLQVPLSAQHAPQVVIVDWEQTHAEHLVPLRRVTLDIPRPLAADIERTVLAERLPPEMAQWEGWYVKDWLWTLLVVCLMVLVLLAALRGLSRIQPGEWLHGHAAAATFVLGLIWWWCLVPSAAGFGLAVAAVIAGLRRRQASAPSAARPT
ncbi:MAG: hypothetical protein KY476_08990, partial [Planctomycetes bacterium]|nr:hypothetical protein [Planctomycetota bacterium]